jgi:L-2-hydroxyglutarate oxidase LhgO
MTQFPDIETVVIGGGAIGLAIASACAAGGQDTAVIERHGAVGQEVSSRSSEVIHAGLYYPLGSLKALACVAGRRRLYDFAAENGVSAKRLGKLVVATSVEELPALKGIESRARKNGVEDVRWLSASEALAMEPDVNCVAALYSPSTGIIDSHDLMKSFEGRLQARNGTVIFKTELRNVLCRADGVFELELASGDGLSKLTARNLYVAGGLGMATLRDVLPRANGYEAPEVCFAKGHYFALRGRSPFRRLIYPVPVPGGLGTHLTLDLQGRARFGPDVQWIDRVDYAFDDPDGKRRAEFESSIRRYWPGLPDGVLEPDYTGVRPKISVKGGESPDFAIHGRKDHGIARMVTLYGIESPGLTSSLAIADCCLSIMTG